MLYWRNGNYIHRAIFKKINMERKEVNLAVKGRQAHTRVWNVSHEIPGGIVTPHATKTKLDVFFLQPTKLLGVSLFFYFSGVNVPGFIS